MGYCKRKQFCSPPSYLSDSLWIKTCCLNWMLMSSAVILFLNMWSCGLIQSCTLLYCSREFSCFTVVRQVPFLSLNPAETNMSHWVSIYVAVIDVESTRWFIQYFVQINNFMLFKRFVRVSNIPTSAKKMPMHDETFWRAKTQVALGILS